MDDDVGVEKHLHDCYAAAIVVSVFVAVAVVGVVVGPLEVRNVNPDSSVTAGP